MSLRIKMSLEDKIDVIIDKLEKTRIDIEVLCTIVKDNKEDIRKNEKDIEEIQEELEKINLEVNDLKNVVKILKYVLGVATTLGIAIIGNIGSYFQGLIL